MIRVGGWAPAPSLGRGQPLRLLWGVLPSSRRTHVVHVSGLAGAVCVLLPALVVSVVVEIGLLPLPSSPLAWMVVAVMLSSVELLLALASLRTLLEQEASCLDPESFQAHAALWHVEEASRRLTRALPPVPFPPGPRHPRL